MPYAIVEDVAANWESYVRFAVDVDERRSHGLLLHAAGRTDEGVRIIEVWESAEAWQRFTGESRRPAGDSFSEAPRSLREFTPTQLVIAGGTPETTTEERHA